MASRVLCTRVTRVSGSMSASAPTLAPRTKAGAATVTTSSHARAGAVDGVKHGEHAAARVAAHDATARVEGRARLAVELEDAAVHAQAVEVGGAHVEVQARLAPSDRAAEDVQAGKAHKGLRGAVREAQRAHGPLGDHSLLLRGCACGFFSSFVHQLHESRKAPTLERSKVAPLEEAVPEAGIAQTTLETRPAVPSGILTV